MSPEDKQWKQFMDIRDTRGTEAAVAFGLENFAPGSANATTLQKGYFPTPEDEAKNRRTWTVASNFLSGRPWDSGISNQQEA
jgi:hypothetical protein